MLRSVAFLVLLVAVAPVASAQTEYDFLLKGGRVIDGKNGISGVRDVAIKDGKIAAVAASIPADRALKAVDVTGLLVTPGLVDMHVHAYHGEISNGYSKGDRSINPDGFTLRSCVTTITDAGSAGWRNFDDFKARVIDKSKTRVTAFLNIVGKGMAGRPDVEQNLADMEVKPTADVAMKYKGVIIGIKSAHFAGPEWSPYERAVEVGNLAKIPVMIDFGPNVQAGRPLLDLLTKYLRPGDILTHMYSGSRGEQAPATKAPSKAMLDGRARGVLFDVGHGSSSFVLATAVPLMKAGFIPDSISTDLHGGSMNAAMKDMLNLMSKFLAMGMSLDDVILRSTWHPAKEIHQEQLGNLSIGSPADVAVLRLEKGSFGFLDPRGGRISGTQKLGCEMTLRDGKVVWELNGLTRDSWDKPGVRGGDPRWDGISPARTPRQ
jgi:dihydroorotase